MIEPGTLYGSSWWIAFGLYDIADEQRTYDYTLFFDDREIPTQFDYANYVTFKEIFLS